MKKNLPAKLAAAALVLCANSALARSGQQIGPMQLSIVVPKVCNATHGGGVAASGSSSASLGSVALRCNSGDAFYVYATHPGGAAAESVSFQFGGETIQASSTGKTLIRSTNRPTNRSLDLTMTSTAPLDESFAVSVSGETTQSGGSTTSFSSTGAGASPTAGAASTGNSGVTVVELFEGEAGGDGSNAELLSF